MQLITMAVCPSSEAVPMDSTEQDLSFSIVWSPLPFITWIIPFIGHLGISNSRGIASDFRGPYFVGDDGRMAFGAPTRALKLDVGEVGAEQWDEAIRQANNIYSQRTHNIFCDKYVDVRRTACDGRARFMLWLCSLTFLSLFHIQLSLSCCLCAEWHALTCIWYRKVEHGKPLLPRLFSGTIPQSLGHLDSVWSISSAGTNYLSRKGTLAVFQARDRYIIHHSTAQSRSWSRIHT